MTDAVLDEIMEELAVEEPLCPRCQRPVVTVQQWTAADQAERDELKAEGYVGPGNRGVCYECKRDMPSEEYLALPPTAVPGKSAEHLASVAQMVKEVNDHMKAGGVLADIAGNYPIKATSISKALSRARKRGEIQ